MSTNNSLELTADEVCASCGVAAVDDIKLKTCDGGCDLVKYCSVECQENHREQHNEECKERKAELHDKDLFTQPNISHRGECPICCLPLSIDGKKSTLMSCCSKSICNGCRYANQKRENDQGLKHRCVYCREPEAKSEEECIKQNLERVKKNDPVAMIHMGKKHFNEGDYVRALQYYEKAAELGYSNGHACLGALYCSGNFVEKDQKRAVYHLEQAAIDGHPLARFILADYENKNNRPDRAAKHYIIAANLGCNRSLQSVKDLFVKGIVSKEEYAAALRGYQAAVDAMKSAERDEAEAFHK